ncbi:MAG: hypothetical protein Q4E60_06520 [Bacteroidales bacterium]|nr:hypothetical protein [Bacteroidales bacterium]
MKKHVWILGACALLAFTACKKTQNNNNGTDSTASQVEPMVSDAAMYTGWQQDALKNSVKEIVTTVYFTESDFKYNASNVGESTTVVYGEDGQREEQTSGEFKHDDHGRIVTSDVENNHSTFGYDEKGRVCQINNEWEGELTGSSETKITYTEKGEIHVVDAYSEGNTWHNVQTYVYTKFDDKGNWIEAQVTDEGEESFEDEKPTKTTNYTVVVREIKYY